MMNIKYLKNPKTREKLYPITKSDCIIDAFSINDLEIDKLFEDSLSVSKHLKGMSYLNLQGLNHYHSKIKDYFNNIPEVLLYTAGENITIENNVISAVIPEVDLTNYQTKSDEQLATQNKTVTGAINELLYTLNHYSELFVDVVESGFYIVDKEFRIGFCVNDSGAHSPNLVEYIK